MVLRSIRTLMRRTTAYYCFVLYPRQSALSNHKDFPAFPAMNVRIATPEGYRPDPGVTAATDELARGSGSSLLITADPQEVMVFCHGIYRCAL